MTSMFAAVGSLRANTTVRRCAPGQCVDRCPISCDANEIKRTMANYGSVGAMFISCIVYSSCPMAVPWYAYCVSELVQTVLTSTKPNDAVILGQKMVSFVWRKQLLGLHKTPVWGLQVKSVQYAYLIFYYRRPMTRPSPLNTSRHHVNAPVMWDRKSVV